MVMELCVSNSPAIYSGGVDFASNRVRLLSLTRFRISQNFGKNSFGCGLRCYSNLCLKSAPDETTIITDDTVDAVNGLFEGKQIPVTKVAGLKDDYNSPTEEEPINPRLKYLEDFGIKKLDTNNAYQLLVLGGGGIVALSLLVGVVSAVDSIPLLPNALELVGLGYSVWFTARYLIFKKNRDELVEKVNQIKEQVLGSDEEASF